MGVFVGVAVGTTVGVAVGTTVGVAVGTTVGVAVGTTVGVGSGVCVNEGEVGVVGTTGSGSSQATAIMTKSSAVRIEVLTHCQ